MREGQFIAMPRKPTDLDKTLAAAAGGLSATVKATVKVAPRLQNQGDRDSPSLKRPRDVSEPVLVAMEVDVVAIDAPLEAEAPAVQDGGNGGTTDEEGVCDQPEKKPKVQQTGSGEGGLIARLAQLNESHAGRLARWACQPILPASSGPIPRSHSQGKRPKPTSRRDDRKEMKRSSSGPKGHG